MVSAAASAQRFTSGLRAGSAETDGISTNCFSFNSNAFRSRPANASRDFLSILNARLLLIPDRDSPEPGIGCSHTNSRGWVDHDALRIAEGGGFLAEVMTFRFE